MKRILFTSAVMLGVLLMGASEAYALRLGPTILDLKAKPGSTLSQAFKITNDSKEPVVLKADFREALPGDNEEGFAKYVSRDESSTLANWISLNGQDQVTLKPGESRDMQLFISVPSSAPAGGHYAMLSWTNDAQAPETTGAGVAGGVGINIALDVAGTVIEKGDVVSFSTEGNMRNYDRLPVSFIARINNGGNRHFRPQGNVLIKNMFGSAVATLPLNVTSGGGNVLPKATRAFKATWDSGFAFGKYTAVLDVTLGSMGSKSAEYTFWVMPAGLVILWLVIAIVIILILVLLIRNMMTSMKK